MLRLDSRNLPDEAQEHLHKLQKKVNAEPDFHRKSEKAGTLWDRKKNSEAGKSVFETIQTTLAEMCVADKVCNYCEQNEANDIEHIYPKAFFPEKAFQWENYLLACKQCNTAYKLDAFAIFNERNEAIPLQRGLEPPSADAAFINPRAEDPADFMMLNTRSYKFDPRPDINTKARNKADYTLQVLALNKRDTLIEARKKAAIYFYERLSRLTKILAAGTVQEIKILLTPYDNFLDDTLPIQKIKENLTNGFKRDIQRHQHPSVWFAIKKIDSQVDTQWKQLFIALPDALNW